MAVIHFYARGPIFRSCGRLYNGMTFRSRILRALLAAMALFCLMCIHLIMNVPNQYEIIQNIEVSQSFNFTNSAACRMPVLDVNDPLIAKLYTKKVEPLKCDSESDWVCIDQGQAFICSATRQRYSNVNCNYTFLRRQTDFSTVDDLFVNGGNEPVDLKSDFFKVSCDNGNGTKWSNIMAGVRNDPAIHSGASWDKIPASGLHLNVLMWGFDSLSRNTFMRKLPKTYKFLTDELGAIVLKSYNIIGDGTPLALIPILTGYTEDQLPETRKLMPNAKPVNVYPFVWKEYQKFGYVTAFNEDRPRLGTFTFRLKGFAQQPTRHYMRTFYIAAAKQLQEHKYLCLRGTPRHKVLMNWIRHFFATYVHKPKFVFSFHSELSHDSYSLVGLADDDLKEFIRNLRDEGYLNNTLLIVMSDHGHRFSKIREYQQGKHEERLPFFSFTFPPWFEKKYPKAMANFKINSDRLTCPFDIHPTLRDILHLEDVSDANTENRSISLFRKIPLNRTCESAGIVPHWCACLDWQSTSTADKMVFRAAYALVNFINNLTEPQRDLCEELMLQSIRWAGKFKPTGRSLKFNINSVRNGFKANLFNKNTNVVLYQVQIHTRPGGGHFEATLKYDSNNKTFTVKEQDISRTNKYGRAANCVEKTQEHLRKFCYCKNIL